MLIRPRWVSLLRTRTATARWYSSSAAGDKGRRLRILFCGSDEFSVRNLDKLRSATDVWESIHILTPRLRKTSIPLLDYAKSKDIPTTQVPKEGIGSYTFPPEFDFHIDNDSHTSHLEAESKSENVLVTASFGHIIPNSFLARFQSNKRLNVHPSLLPKYRGAAPIQWTIVNGDSTTGVSVQRLVEKGKGIDGGDIVGSVAGIVVKDDSTYKTLLDDVSEIGGNLLVDVLRRIHAGTDKGHPQDPNAISRAPKITHETARIKWSETTSTQIDRLSRGISHQYPLWTTFNGASIQLFNLNLHPLDPESNLEAEPGTARLIRKEGKMIVACAGGSWVQVERVKAQGKKEVGVNDWWNGLPKGFRESKEIRFE